MPVYLVTCHAYRSWSEANPRGYVQRDEGLKPPSEKLARWRADHSGQPPMRFDDEQKRLLLDVVEELADEDGLTLHGASATATHLHKLVSFQSPMCSCGAADHCRKGCPARGCAEAFATHVKRVGGCRLAKAAAVRGRKWFSHGWDVTPVRGRGHFDHLVKVYLPGHRDEGGVVRIDPLRT